MGWASNLAKHPRARSPVCGHCGCDRQACECPRNPERLRTALATVMERASPFHDNQGTCEWCGEFYSHTADCEWLQYRAWAGLEKDGVK